METKKRISQIIKQAVDGDIGLSAATTEILVLLTCSGDNSLKAKAEPLMRHLAKDLPPHHTAIVTATSCEIFQSQKSTGDVLDYLVD